MISNKSTNGSQIPTNNRYTSADALEGGGGRNLKLSANPHNFQHVLALVWLCPELSRQTHRVGNEDTSTRIQPQIAIKWGTLAAVSDVPCMTSSRPLRSHVSSSRIILRSYLHPRQHPWIADGARHKDHPRGVPPEPLEPSHSSYQRSSVVRQKPRGSR